MGVALTAEPMQAWQGVLVKVNVIVNNASLETRLLAYSLFRINNDNTKTLLDSNNAWVPPLGAMQVGISIAMPLGDLRLHAESYYSYFNPDIGMEDWALDAEADLTVAYIAPIAAQFQTLEAQFLKV